MNDVMFWFVMLSIIELLVVSVAFIISCVVVKFIINKLKESQYLKHSRFFNPTEYLPDEEVITLKQVFYLIMIVLFVVNILYLFNVWSYEEYYIILLDILLSIYLAIHVERDSLKNKLILLLLIPFGSLGMLLFENIFLSLLDLVHFTVFIYFIKVYFNKFLDYTESNSLGITILLLFSIVFVSFLITMAVENVSPIDSWAMVSNAFTSNGYSVLGKSLPGKLNSIFLVWSGFVLSSAGTATLTVAIVMKHINGDFDRLEELAKRNRKD